MLLTSIRLTEYTYKWHTSITPTTTTTATSNSWIRTKPTGHIYSPKNNPFPTTASTRSRNPRIPSSSNPSILRIKASSISWIPIMMRLTRMISTSLLRIPKLWRKRFMRSWKRAKKIRISIIGGRLYRRPFGPVKHPNLTWKKILSIIIYRTGKVWINSNTLRKNWRLIGKKWWRRSTKLMLCGNKIKIRWVWASLTSTNASRKHSQIDRSIRKKSKTSRSRSKCRGVLSSLNWLNTGQREHDLI